GAPMTAMGFGWMSTHASGKGKDTITSGLEGPWTANPTTWDMGYFDVLFGYDWELTKSPAGAWIWHAKDLGADDHAPEVDGSGETVPLMMSTADMAMRMDPDYEQVSRRFHADPELFADAFARAWFKLTHRDMGPKIRYLGPDVPEEDLIWQDPVPEVDHPLIDAADIAVLKAQLLESGLSTAELVRTAWASAATFRGSDKRGGANGARIRLNPQKDWAVNRPEELARVLTTLAQIKASFDAAAAGGKQVSLADLIVLGGVAAVEAAAKAAGQDIIVPFTPGRTDTDDARTDADSFSVLEPIADGFRNFQRADYAMAAEEMLVDKAQLLGLTAPEMTVLVGGMRVLGANADDAGHGIFTDRPGHLTTDFFVNLLDMGTEWVSTTTDETEFEGRDRATGAKKWTATRVDLVFGSNSQLRAISEVYGQAGADAKFVKDFVAAWTKVMEADRFDLHD
ncbi:MAG: peroxidase family protein, partial [Pseudomonadota bacterium]